VSHGRDGPSAVKLYVVGDLGRLPDRPRDAVEARRAETLDQAGAAVAVAPEDGDWDPLWAQLRQAFQDRGLAVHAVWIDGDGCSRCPRKPWPGVRWVDPVTRHRLVWYRLARDPRGYDPGDCRVLFPRSKHLGKTLREVPVAYVDWLLGQDWVEPDSFFGRMARLYLGRLAAGHLLHLLDEPFDTRGFSPLDAQPGVTVTTVFTEEDDPRNVHWRSCPAWGKVAAARRRKPGFWPLTRPRQQVEAEDEAINQVWSAVGGQRLIWPEGLGLEPMPTLHARKARSRVYWAVIDDKPVVKGGHDDGLRVVIWDRTLEAIDRVATAPDLRELGRLHRRAVKVVEALALSEGLDPDGNPLKDELDEAYLRRRDQLERREEPLTDVQGADVTDDEEAARKGRRRCVGSRVVQKLAADMQAARVHEVIRRLRGCRTLDDLADVGLWVGNNRELFTEDSLAKLRGWYAHFKAEVVKSHLEELQAKYGEVQPAVAGV
jgi:hypothetical protein